MKVICQSNSQNDIPKSIRKYAYTQDEEGVLDITPNREYEVFGMRTYLGQSFFLVHTDTIHAKYPWWMPSELYEVIDSTIPAAWERRVRGAIRKDTIVAPVAYHGNENLIEDGKASEDVMKAIYSDSN